MLMLMLAARGSWIQEEWLRHPDSNRLRGGSALKSAAPLYCQTLFGHSPRICPAPDSALSVSGLITDTAWISNPNSFLPVLSQKSSSEWRSCVKKTELGYHSQSDPVRIQIR